MMIEKFAATVVVALSVGGVAFAQHDPAMHQHAAGQMQAGHEAAHSLSPHRENVAESQEGPHGGSLSSAEGVQLETLVEPGGIRLFAYDAQGQPLDLRNVRGVATLKLDGAAKRYRYDLYPSVRQDQSAEALAVQVDLRSIAGHQGELSFQLVGLTDGRRPTTFTQAFTGPMGRTAAAIAEQQVCPVTGAPLGSMGDPIPVTADGETIYVCCAGCVEKVKANFAEYKRKLAANPEPTVAPATQSDTEAIKQQQVCPVTGQPLGSMGTPLKVTGLERDVYLCCQGCVDRFKAEPQTYLAKLPPVPQQKPEVTKATESDAKYVAAQKVCPVMDEPLDAMGGPYKTSVNGKVVYLCCPGCAKLLHAEPEKYLAKLREQGVEPPTAK